MKLYKKETMGIIAYLKIAPTIILYCPDILDTEQATAHDIPFVVYDNGTELWEEALPAHHLAVEVEWRVLKKINRKLHQP